MLYKLGNFFSKLILKNIYLFIALGIINWSSYYFPNLELYGKYFEIYLLPMALAYTAGNFFEKNNGGIISIIAMSITMYLTPYPSLNQGIALGVVCGLLTKYLNIFIKKHIPGVLQMFLLNFFYPIIALGTGVSFYIILKYTNQGLSILSQSLINIISNFYSLVILTPLLEIGKVFFFNNIINHGFLSLLGFNELSTNGKSLLFLLETNPGPGLGVLLGIFFTRSKTSNKINIFWNMFAQTIGGIHEIYFPYVLKNLKLLWAVCLGGLTSNLIFYFFNSGLIGVASPGSILNIILLSKEKDINPTLLGFLSSTLVSFITAYMILKCSKRKITLEKIEGSSINLNYIKKIVFMCDAGMGSSAIGANMLRNILKNTKYKNIEITNTYIGDKLDSSDTIVTHEKLKSPVKNRYSNNSIVFLQDFLDKDFYIEKFLKEEFIEIYTELSLKSTSKEKALEKLGEDIESLDLAEKGYKESILERERSCSTFLGNGVAIPHGLHSSLKLLKKNAVIIHHYPYGIDFGEDEKVYILVGLLIKDQNLRVEYLSNIVKNIENEELMEALTLSDDKEEFIEAFNGGMYVK